MREIRATVPLGAPPAWAVLERRLFDALDEAWRAFAGRYCGPDGRLIYHGPAADRDGADDFYEAFFNWPTLYQLGGADDLLGAAKQHWEGVTAQLTELGYLVEEYERGYDWFHQGESMLLFYGICAADPRDERFAERARRFAELYLPGSANYDAEHDIIRAPAQRRRRPPLRPAVGVGLLPHRPGQHAAVRPAAARPARHHPLGGPRRPVQRRPHGRRDERAHRPR
ncbi:hypothetical protein [Nonomuraea salmonea]|uniref:hypothetical protein n=1 Tax=Nonomuraea salmonea TaxID=46181 RepID=UPI0031E96276